MSRGFLLGSTVGTLGVMPKPVDSQCRAFQTAIEVLGRPWNALILNVLQGGRLRFSELSERAEGPGGQHLVARLKELEARGLLVRHVDAGPPVREAYELTRVRHVDAGPPVRVAYELTRIGRTFGQLAEAIERWGRELMVEAKPRRR